MTYSWRSAADFEVTGRGCISATKPKRPLPLEPIASYHQFVDPSLQVAFFGSLPGRAADFIDKSLTGLGTVGETRRVLSLLQLFNELREDGQEFVGSDFAWHDGISAHGRALP